MFELAVEDGLVLRLLEPRHAEALFRLVDRNRDSLGHWFPWVEHTKTVADSEAFTRLQPESFAQGDGCQLGIWSEGVYIGNIGFGYVSREFRCAEVGYWLSAEHRGRGVMTKVCRYLCGYLFNEQGLNRVEIRCAETNLNRAVPERLGFRLEGTLREMGYTRDGLVAQLVYSLLKREWQP